MIGVDTNVVLRRLLDDDATQSAKANRLFAGKQDILITDVVLVELAWTLSGKRYSAAREDIVSAITGLFEEPRVQFEDRAVVWTALRDYAEAPMVKTANGSRSADFADALIARKSAATAAVVGVSFGGLFTFDQPAQRLAGVRAL